jgi:hypothetical protein
MEVALAIGRVNRYGNDRHEWQAQAVGRVKVAAASEEPQRGRNREIPVLDDGAGHLVHAGPSDPVIARR